MLPILIKFPDLLPILNTKVLLRGFYQVQMCKKNFTFLSGEPGIRSHWLATNQFCMISFQGRGDTLREMGHWLQLFLVPLFLIDPTKAIKPGLIEKIR